MSWLLELSSASNSILITVCDAAGAGVDGLVAATLPDIYWSAPGAAATQITLSDLVAVDSAWSSGGVKGKGSGEYRLDLPDALSSGVAAGTRKVFGSDGTNTVIPADINLVITQVFPDNFAAMGIDAFGNVQADAAETRAALGMASADLDTQLDAIAGAITDPLLESVPGSYTQGTAGWALGKIGTGKIYTNSAVAIDGSVTIQQGAAYKTVYGNAIDWVDTDADVAWPILTGAEIRLYANNGAIDIPGEVVTATGSPKKVRVQLSSTSTGAIPAGVYSMQVVAIFSGTGTDEDEIPLVQGLLTVLDREAD